VFSETAIDLLKLLEESVVKDGFHVVYDDYDNNTRWNGKESFKAFTMRCKGTPTIGYGITDKKILSKLKISDYEAEQYLIAEANKTRRHILNLVKIKLTHYQREAMVSFVYNIGITNFKKSTLLKKLNENRLSDVPKEMLRWKYKTVKGEKVVCDGLVKRRIKEIEFFNGK